MVRLRIGVVAALGLLLASEPPAAIAEDARPTVARETERAIVLRAMRERPGDPWPRGRGHVVLAVPGSPQTEKAYHEPGGSFSPAPGSFGVAIWVLDGTGAIVATSDSIPLDEVSQGFAWLDPEGPPTIRTETRSYRASWSRDPAGGWRLELSKQPSGAGRLALAIRSVGPAGGPIRRISRDGATVRLGERWSVTFDPAPAAIHLGREGDPGWTTARSDRVDWTDEGGWGWARIEPTGSGGSLRIRDSVPPAAVSLSAPVVRSGLRLDLPDRAFVEAIEAQVAHLLMGLLDRTTPPGEPTNYPLAWQRDGAAVVAALARAGRLDVARQLVDGFAERDFFGGFGSEADAPGQGLGVIEDVAVRLKDRDFDGSMWPHVRRKAALILEMLRTPTPIRRPWTGPIVPAHRGKADLDLVCDPARDGLIVGRMDWHRPILYVNAVSYQGLRGAAALAGRLGHEEEARAWRSAAAALGTAWAAAFETTERNNERTWICGLWPTWVAARIRDRYAAEVESRCGVGFGVPWTYFTAAAAHQLVMAGRPELARRHIEWFRDHQTSPGLYTWWESTGEENTFGLWEDVRGWVAPPHVTPHYWTAAEVLALLVDTLTHVDESGAEPVLVIGAGVPASWLDGPIAVAGVPTPLGTVDWSWSPGKAAVTVTVPVPTPAVRLGPAFPAGAEVDVRAPR